MEQKLLIVDDEAHIRMLIEQTLEDLEDEGVELLFAENGEQALELIKKEEPNLVFLDVMMPKMNGMEVCYKVKKELHLSHQHSPRAHETHEHYCRRWVSLKVLKDISKSKKAHEFDIQISNYGTDEKNYLVLSSATKDPFKENQYRSISIGLLINKQLERKLKFLKDKAIKTQEVGVTCQRCAIKNCKVRQAQQLFWTR